MNTPEKIAILGGGVGSLVTAFELTESENWRQKYDITVYQLGWRLGGKGASGRGEYARIEEHGIHMWGGCYENSFHVMRRVYDEYAKLNLYPETPVSTIEQAFIPQELYVLEEFINDTWKSWPIMMKATPGVYPGTGDEVLTIADAIVKLIRWIYGQIDKLDGVVDHPGADAKVTAKTNASADANSSGKSAKTLTERFNWLADDDDVAAHFNENFTGTPEAIKSDVTQGVGAGLTSVLDELVHLLDRMVKNGGGLVNAIVKMLEKGISEFIKWVEDRISGITGNDEVRRILLMIRLALIILSGLIEDHVIIDGFTKLNNEDFTQWLIRHGAGPDICDSAPVRSIYLISFLYLNGMTEDIDNYKYRSVAAGNWLYWMLRMAFTSQGATFFRMSAGMGDIIFSPLYVVLKQRGVKFEFFNNVKNLGLNADKTAIETITVEQQVKLKNGTYDPIQVVKGMPCWPSEPLYDQIDDADRAALIAGKINLESFWTPWDRGVSRQLVAGQHFDKVVLGITLSALQYICPELVAANEQWRDMVTKVPSVYTHEYQLWFNKSMDEMRAPGPQAAVMSFVEPGDTGVDMRQNLPAEDWPPDNEPKALWMTGGVMHTPPDSEVPPSTDHGYPQRELDKARALIVPYLEQYASVLWPHATSPTNPNGLDWSLLYDLDNREGIKRLEAQYMRANVNPTDRYVQLAANTTQYRLAPDNAQFDRLYLTGDWVDVGVFSFGNVEGAVIGGMYASRAICGVPKRIIGE